MTAETAIPVFFIGVRAAFFGVLLLTVAIILKIRKGSEDRKLLRRFARLGVSLLALALASPFPSAPN